MTAIHADEVEQVVNQLITRLIKSTITAVEHTDALVIAVWNMTADVCAETAQVCRDGGDTHRHTFHRRVAPGLVVAGEDAHVAAADQLLVIQMNQRTGRRDKLRMEHHLHRIIRAVEQMAMAEMFKHRIGCIVDQIVRDNRRGLSGAPGVHGAF